MKTIDVQNLYKEFVLPTYAQVPICLVKGKGSYVWDIEGKEYLDFFPGWAVSGLGHCHPAVISALKHQAKSILHVSNNFCNVKQARLAEEISKNCFPARTFFCSSGAEASEAAIKFAKRYGHETGRYEIITMKQSFHGRTLAAMTATGQPKFHKGFEPLPEGFLYADFNDLESVKNLVSDKTIAIMLEPVQGEGGVNVASSEFMKGVRDLCCKRDLLMILDEVQTGMGRTGKMFGYQNYEIEPDLMTLAKTLGAGVPIGALVVNKNLKREVFTAGVHAATFGGNPLVAVASLAVFKTIKKEKLISNVNEMGNLLVGKLESLRKKYPVIEYIKGIGLMRALKLKKESLPYAEEALKRGLIINSCQNDILRIMPAMTVTPKLITKAIAILDSTFNSLSKKGE